MVSEVAVTEWVRATESSWTTLAAPAGALPGDLVVLVRVGVYPAGMSSPLIEDDTSSWTLAADDISADKGTKTEDRFIHARRMWSRRVGADGVAPSVTFRKSRSTNETGGYAYQMRVLRDTAGLGGSASGVKGLTVKPGGGMLAMAAGRDPVWAGESRSPALSASRDAIVISGGSWSWETFRSAQEFTTLFAPAVDGFAGEPGTTKESRVVEVLPPVAPAAPTLLAPEQGADIGAPGAVTYRWAHNSADPAGAQDAYRLRLSTGKDALYWDATTGTFSPTMVTNVSPVEQVEVATGGLLVGSVPTWEVQTRDARTQEWSPWSPPGSHRVVAAPTVTDTAPTVFTEDLTPTLTWSASTPQGVQTAYRVQVVDGTRVLFDTGVVRGANNEYTLPVLDWANGGSYTRRLWIEQSGGSSSAWAETPFALSWTPPAAPVVSVHDYAPGVQVMAAAQGAGATVTVERADGDGWARVATDVPVTDGAAVVRDVFAPYGVVSTYRARVTAYLDGQPFTSAWAESGAVVCTDRWAYLAPAAAPQSFVELVLTQDTERVPHRDVAVTYGLGSDRAMVDRGPLGGEEGTMVALVQTQAERAALTALVEGPGPLLVRWPADRAANGGGYVDGGRSLIAVAGVAARARTFDRAALEPRFVTIPWVEQ